MNLTEAAVRSAKNPQEAMLAIARALDVVITNMQEQATRTYESPWGEWEAEDDERRTAISGDDKQTDIVIPPPSEEKKEARRQFERQNLKLAEHLGDGEDWAEAYAKGGPMWLYLGNRELVMSYPESVRAALVADVIEDSPQDAHEMGRDVLKQAGEDGPGSVAMMANDQIVNVP